MKYKSSSKAYSYLKFCLLVNFIFLSVSLFANNADSLIQTLTYVKGQERIETLIDLSWELKYSDQKASLAYGLEGLELARQDGNRKLEAELLKNIGTSYYLKSEYALSKKYSLEAFELYQKFKNVEGIATIRNILGLNESVLGNFENALQEFEQSKLLFQSLGDSSRVISIQANIGNIHLYRDEYEKAIPLYNQIVQYARSTNDQEKLALNTFNLGTVYVKLGDYIKALEILYESAALSKQLGNQVHWIKAQNEIGLVLKRLELYEEAINLYQNALEKANEIENQNLVASLSNNLGLCYLRSGNLDAAWAKFSKSLEIRKSLQIDNVGHILNNLGSVHYEKKNFERALNYYNQALEINSKLDLKGNIAIDKSDIGQIHLEQGNIKLAEEMFLSAFQLLSETKQLKELASTTKNLTHLYKQTKQDSTALYFESLHQTYSDSLTNVDKMIEATRIVVREQLKENSLKIESANEALAKAKNERTEVKNKNEILFWSFFGVLFLLIVCGIAFRVRMISNRKKLTQKIARINQEKDDLNASIEKQNRELILFSLDAIQKESLINAFKTRLSALLKKQPENQELRRLMNQFDISNLISKDWSFFNKAFNKTFPNFIKNIQKLHPDLSQKELQHCILIKLNTPPVQAANILGINTESVHTARYRLRKKLNLERKESLESTIHNF